MAEIDIIRERIDVAQKASQTAKQIKAGPYLDLIAIHGGISRAKAQDQVDKLLGVTVHIVNPSLIDSYLNGFQKGVVISSLQKTEGGYRWALDMLKGSLKAAAKLSEDDGFALWMGAFVGSRILPTTDAPNRILELGGKMVDLSPEDLFEELQGSEVYGKSREVTYSV